MRNIILILGLFLLMSCNSSGKKEQLTDDTQYRVIVDALGRSVKLPDTISGAICIRASALRLVSYAGGAPFITGVEEPELRNREYSHLCAFPYLATKPSIGPNMGGDIERIIGVNPDVIFMSTTTVADADELQSKVGIPVVTIEYGDMGRNRETFYSSLRTIGRVLGTERHVDSLIQYVNAQIADLKERTEGLSHRPDVYVGGISYKGSKDITSTDPYYAALEMIQTRNVADVIDPRFVSPITGTYIDIEALITWNPEVIFVDYYGMDLVKDNFRTNTALLQTTKAGANHSVYQIWPYNNYHSNFDVMLMNAWYMGKILYPDRFADVDMNEKVNEISNSFYGQPIGDCLTGFWGNYSLTPVL